MDSLLRTKPGGEHMMRSTAYGWAFAAALALSPAVARAGNTATAEGNRMESKGNAEEKAADAEKAKGKHMQKQGEAVEKAGDKNDNAAEEHAGKRTQKK